MSLIGKSLDAVTTPTVGSSILFDVPKQRSSIYYNVTGSPDSFTLVLEATPDGSTWFQVGTSGPTGMHVVNVVDTVVLGLRANLTAISGGTSPTVTAWIAAA